MLKMRVPSDSCAEPKIQTKDKSMVLAAIHDYFQHSVQVPSNLLGIDAGAQRFSHFPKPIVSGSGPFLNELFQNIIPKQAAFVRGIREGRPYFLPQLRQAQIAG